MKHSIALLIICLVILSGNVIAETNDCIFPDVIEWGISQDEFKKSYKNDYKECEVGKKKALMVSNVNISSFDMNVYYVFGNTMHDSSGATYVGLSKIAYILQENSILSTEELKNCYNILVDVLTEEIGDSGTVSKGVTRWENKSRKIEVGKGKFENYTGSKNPSVAVVITGINISNPTNESISTSTSTSMQSKSIFDVLDLPDIRINKDFSIQKGKIRYGTYFEDIVSMEDAKKSILTESKRAGSSLASDLYEDLGISRYIKFDNHQKDVGGNQVIYYFDHYLRLISVGYIYNSNDADYKDLKNTLVSKYGVPSQKTYNRFTSALYKSDIVLDYETDYLLFYLNKALDMDINNVDVYISEPEQWLLHFNDCFVVIDLYYKQHRVDDDSSYSIQDYRIGYNMYSNADLVDVYNDIVKEMESAKEEQRKIEKDAQRKKRKISDDL